MGTSTKPPPAGLRDAGPPVRRGSRPSRHGPRLEDEAAAPHGAHRPPLSVPPSRLTPRRPPQGRAGRQRLALTSRGLPGSGLAVGGVEPPDGRPVSRPDAPPPQEVIHRLLAPAACRSAKGDLPSAPAPGGGHGCTPPPPLPRNRGTAGRGGGGSGGGEGGGEGGGRLPAAQLLPCASSAIASPGPTPPLRRGVGGALLRPPKGGEGRGAQRRRLTGRAPRGCRRSPARGRAARALGPGRWRRGLRGGFPQEAERAARRGTAPRRGSAQSGEGLRGEPPERRKGETHPRRRCPFFFFFITEVRDQAA